MLEEMDVFGIFDGPQPPPATHLTVQQYRTLVQYFAQKLALGDVSFLFNLPLLNTNDNDYETTDDECHETHTESEILHEIKKDMGVVDNLCRNLSPPVCVHIARENGLQAIQHPQLLPTVVFDETDESVAHVPPHVHCLFCMNEGNEKRDETAPVLVKDLRHSLLAHYTQYMEKRDACLALLEAQEEKEEERETADTAEKEQEMCGHSELHAEMLESTADHAGRHACFVVSAGTAASPIIVVYCAACNQLAPLVSFIPSSEVPAKSDKEQEDEGYVNDGVEEKEEREMVSVETVELIMARVLLACDLLLSLKREREQAVGSMAFPRIQEESYIFLPTPFLFGEEAEALTEMFENGAILTHSSAVLPLATVMGTPNAPRLCLLDPSLSSTSTLSISTRTTERRVGMESILGDLPPYYFSNAVVGFVMRWSSEAETNAKVEWVLQQDTNLSMQRRLVFVEDTDEWIIAYVFHHRDVSSVEGNNVGNDPYSSIRLRENCSIVKMVPLTLLQQYKDGENSKKENKSNNNTDNNSEMCEAVGECPYSMESRTINYFASMMALAKAMGIVADYFKGKVNGTQDE
ncbi:hypothetical protein LSM04_001700 [Trypanosoma melophagium]|uniref:uncharacterized protein n=1 Tax=Trypanosoma melophagium TaxID=715481 RepID=UPI003519EC12|nr:hypothetical protein LSM04_001700 [Trypanosoma melophagium]